ncbi:WD40 repeat-like protein [Armillaria solidipes]|uniref:WD40 repeat-like protein n=1 Tax=Armillaria solidipes TaxID=1076256 RepID=A0A2H3ATT3_9AGAR|nr:WD40 repeat-like protein [Armillaria solidipes]
MPNYRLLKRFKGLHLDSINAIAFSPDGSMMASADDQGKIIVTLTVNGRNVNTFSIAGASVTVLRWYSNDSALLFAGLRSGKLYACVVSPGAYVPREPTWICDLAGPIRVCLVDSTSKRMVIGHGNSVSVLRQIALYDWRLSTTIAQPVDNVLKPLNFEDPALVPTGVHIPPSAPNQLLISYLDHGILCYDLDEDITIWRVWSDRRIGASALSIKGDAFVATNLYDGIDFYSTVKRTRINRAALHILENVLIPIEFIHEDESVLVGSSTGIAVILSTELGREQQVLVHGSSHDLIQAVDYTVYGGRQYIATGDSEKGDDTQLQVWVSVDSKQRAWLSEDLLRVCARLYSPPFLSSSY